MVWVEVGGGVGRLVGWLVGWMNGVSNLNLERQKGKLAPPKQREKERGR